MANESTVKFGLSNMVFAPETTTDTYSDELIRFPGAVNLTREAQGEESNFFADNQIYYVTRVFQGFTGELEMAKATEEMEEKLWGDEKDETTGIMKESRDAKVVKGALGFQINGDNQNRRFWYYGATLSRPNTDASTTTDSAEPQTDTMNLTVTGLTNSDVVGIKTSSTSPEEVYNKFLDKVVMPDQYEELQAV